MNAAAMLQICPRCGCLSLMRDDSLSGESEFCVTCGSFTDETSQCDVPHFNYSYRWKGDLCNLADPCDRHGEPDIFSKATAEAWIQSCESDGFEFTHFVMVDTHYKVHWLRGNPSGQ
ncbi:MAG: hypothetical protein HYR70_04470 [Chloroflexi bacterium]|nr:hypothetical protein [Chloroflexota bacterium]MBI3340811.1 hypothetical protein [Chloroflexota bacterium]